VQAKLIIVTNCYKKQRYLGFLNLLKVIQDAYYLLMMKIKLYRETRCQAAAALLVALFTLSGCSDVPQALNGLNSSYDAAIQATDGAVVFEPGSATEVRTLERLEQFFTRMTPESVREQVAGVYAAHAYLNDNIVGITGRDRISEYFAHAAGQSEVLNVEFLDVSRSEHDYFIRWKMTVQAKVLSGGEPVVTYGVSQFRFDGQGLVLLHRDFWDAATGMYEHLPYIGRIVRYVQSKLAGEWGS